LRAGVKSRGHGRPGAENELAVVTEKAVVLGSSCSAGRYHSGNVRMVGVPHL
jgi:hypothetical protein